jgi:hypothetical protein
MMLSTKKKATHSSTRMIRLRRAQRVTLKIEEGRTMLHPSNPSRQPPLPPN